MSGGREIVSLPSTVVRVTADDGTQGFGETCPLGPAYLPAHGDGARAALRELAPALLGVDPRELAIVNDALDAALLGHAYAKSAIDVACWDLLGKVDRVSPSASCSAVAARTSYPLYVAIPLGPPEEMAAHVRARRDEGIHHFQLKLGADPHDDARRVRAVLEASGGRGHRRSPTPTAAGGCRTPWSPRACWKGSIACSSSSRARRSRSASTCASARRCRWCSTR